ncbi:MAG TPA: phospho-N-acetylmuramoyl-pentapeptide-transferase [Blastocatellia bacterium]|nr:phospho-N-acetylmuramoyl-pentapeptide-transferase [Blastocatellia bacterium]
MLYYLLYEYLRNVHESLSWLRVFEFVTFRTAYASITALLISLSLGGRMIKLLQQFQIGQQIRAEGPASHMSKRGTPTMGGILIVVSVVVSTLLWAKLNDWYVWIATLSILLYGGVGFLDDYSKIVKSQSLGLTGRQKLALQFAIAVVLGLILIFVADYKTTLSIPFIKTFTPKLWWPIYLAFIMLVVGGFSNAVNLTDGLDGLAISITFVTATALTAFTYVTGHPQLGPYLGLVYEGRVWELTIFCGALAGASLGFLWFNAPPAQVFMGDVGSLGIGGAIGMVAVLIKQEFLLVMIGGVFIMETLSVMMQVTSFKLLHKRIFKMSPIHHHFELLGWKESKIVFRFLILAILFALLSLSTLKLR